MLTTLMESVPTNSEIDTKVLIESLKKEFTVNAAILDSNNGINKDIVKTITEEKVKVEKEKVEKNKEQEAKREAQNSKSVEEAIGNDENEKNNIEENTKDNDFAYVITLELKELFDRYYSELGLNIDPTEEPPIISNSTFNSSKALIVPTYARPLIAPPPNKQVYFNGFVTFYPSSFPNISLYILHIAFL